MQESTNDDATTDNQGRLKSPHISPTLAHIRGDGIGEPGPDDAVACRTCPVAVWYWKGKERVFCYCAAMHQHTWGAGEEPILFCDAREEEVAKLLAALGSAPMTGIEG